MKFTDGQWLHQPGVIAHYAAEARFTLGVGEYVYGLGERFTAFVKNGQVVEIEDTVTGFIEGMKQRFAAVCFSFRLFLDAGV